MPATRAALGLAVSAFALTIATAARAENAPVADAATDAAAPVSDTTADTPAAFDQEIVVTASRRNERLRDVPSAVTALDGEKLNQLGVRDAKDYLSLVPGVSLRDYGAPGQGTLIIRGLNSGSQQLTNTAATYIDDAPFSASGFLSVGAILTPDPDIADLDRIEVLKGPQGTLYGANSLGGLVRIISKRPDVTTFSGYGRIEGSSTAHGDESYGLHGSVNIPIVSDQLALRVNAVYRHVGGYVDNAATGEQDTNWSTIKGGRASLRWRPASNLTFDLSGMLQDIHNNSGAGTENVSGTLIPLYGKYRYSSGLETPGDIKYRLAMGTVDYDMGPVALIATGSYAQYKTHLLSDYSDSYLPYLRIASPLYAAALPANALLLGNLSPNMDKWTAELRAVSKRLGPVEFVAGGFYTNEHNVYNTTITAQDSTAKDLTGNFVTGIPLKDLLITRTLSDYEEVAGFVNGTFYIADNLDVGGGIRYAHNSQFGETGGPNANSFYIKRATADFRFKDSVATYLATIRYRPSTHVSFYLRAASGYRPGGPQTNANPPAGAQTFIRPDSTWNYEGGVKGSFGAFGLEASVYHIDWKDIQLNTLAGGTVLGANGGDAKVDGFELALSARPGPLTTLSANVGYTDARMTAVIPGVKAYLGVVPGDKLPLTPDWTVSVLADQGVPLGEGVKGDLGAALRFRSDMPSSFPGATSDPSIKIPSYATLDLRAGVTFGGRYEVQARVENLFDTYAFTSASTPRIYAGQQVPTGATVIRPRTFSLAVSANF